MQRDENGRIALNNISGTVLTHAVILPSWRKTPNGGTQWLLECQCDLKTKAWVWAEVVKRCPDWRCKECRKKIQSEQHTTHGKRYTKKYTAWRAMHYRCDPNNAEEYPSHAGRNITVCERWKVFENFDADVPDPPSGEFTIDRTDNDGNYEPGNVEWKDREGQANNRRTNKWLEYNGENHTWSQWSRITGIDKTTIRRRVLRGWPPERVLSREGCHS